MTSTPEDAELLSVTDATAAIEQTIKRLRQAALFNNEFVLRDSEECTHFATTLQTLLSALKSRLLSPAIAPGTLKGAAYEIDSALEGIPSIYDHDHLYQRKTFLGVHEFEELPFTIHDLREALTASPATEPVTQELGDYLVYWTSGPRALAQALLSQFNITRKVQP